MNYIWGLDLSLKNTGVAVYDGSSLTFIHVSSITTDDIRNVKANKDKYLNGLKLYKIQEELRALSEKYPPSVVVIERGFSRFNTATQVIYRVHGVVNALFHDVNQIYYPPKEVKATIVSGTASKLMVQQFILKEYPDLTFDNEDESDAVAVALTYVKKNLVNTQ